MDVKLLVQRVLLEPISHTHSLTLSLFWECYKGCAMCHPSPNGKTSGRGLNTGMTLSKPMMALEVARSVEWGAFPQSESWSTVVSKCEEGTFAGHTACPARGVHTVGNPSKQEL